MVDAADWPEEGFVRGGGRPFDTPETGSAFDEGHKLLGGFFLGAEEPCSAFRAGASPFVWGKGTGTVTVEEEEVEDADAAIEDEEFVLCALLRGMNIRVTSSAFIECNPPCPASPGFH